MRAKDERIEMERRLSGEATNQPKWFQSRNERGMEEEWKRNERRMHERSKNNHKVWTRGFQACILQSLLRVTRLREESMGYILQKHQGNKEQGNQRRHGWLLIIITRRIWVKIQEKSKRTERHDSIIIPILSFLFRHHFICCHPYSYTRVSFSPSFPLSFHSHPSIKEYKIWNWTGKKEGVILRKKRRQSMEEWVRLEEECEGYWRRDRKREQERDIRKKQQTEKSFGEEEDASSGFILDQ